MNNITKLRVKSKMTEDAICKAIGISRKSLYNYEKEKSSIPSNVLIKLADLFGCTTDYVLGITNYTTISVYNKSYELVLSVKGNEAVEHKDYKIVYSDD